VEYIVSADRPDEYYFIEMNTALTILKDAARSGGNVFAALMDAARVCTLQRITEGSWRSAASTGATCERATMSDIIRVAVVDYAGEANAVTAAPVRYCLALTRTGVP
jgi:hypothetical protein